MASERDGILAAIVAAIDAAGKPAGLVVDRFRVRPRDPSAGGAVGVYFAGETVALRAKAVAPAGPAVTRTMKVRAAIQMLAATDPADVALDPLYVWVVRQVLSDPTVLALVREIAERELTPDAEASKSGTIARLYVDFEAIYDTPEVP